MAGEMRHDQLTNHATDVNQRNLHFPGIVVADAATLATYVVVSQADLAYQTDGKLYQKYDGQGWRPICEVVLKNITTDTVVPANCSMVVQGMMTFSSGKTLTFQVGGIVAFI